MHAIDELAAKAVPEEPKPATVAPSAEVAVLPPPPSRRITRSQSKVLFPPPSQIPVLQTATFAKYCSSESLYAMLKACPCRTERFEFLHTQSAAACRHSDDRESARGMHGKCTLQVQELPRRPLLRFMQDTHPIARTCCVPSDTHARFGACQDGGTAAEEEEAVKAAAREAAQRKLEAAMAAAAVARHPSPAEQRAEQAR